MGDELFIGSDRTPGAGVQAESVLAARDNMNYVVLDQSAGSVKALCAFPTPDEAFSYAMFVAYQRNVYLYIYSITSRRALATVWPSEASDSSESAVA